MAEREIGVGVIGYGLGGRVFHAPFVNAVQGLRLCFFIDSSKIGKSFSSLKVGMTILISLFIF